MLRLYSAVKMLIFGMRQPSKDAQDGFNGIFYAVKAMLATDHNVNRIASSSTPFTCGICLTCLRMNFLFMPRKSARKG